jgi:hypothetical protein
MAIEIFTRLGRLVRVKNTNKKGYSGEREDFIAVWVKGNNGPKCLLFTDGEIERAEARAQKNPEDLTKRSLISELID